MTEAKLLIEARKLSEVRKGGERVGMRDALVVLKCFEPKELLDLLGFMRVVEMFVDDEDRRFDVGHLRLTHNQSRTRERQLPCNRLTWPRHRRTQSLGAHCRMASM